MTTPDQSKPDGAISSTGLAAFANKSEEDWRAEQKSDMEGAWSAAQEGFYRIVSQIPIIGDILEIFTGKEDGDLNDLGSWVNGITKDVRTGLDNFAKLVGSVGGTIINDVGDAINGAVKGISDTWNSFWNGIFGTNTSGKKASDVQIAAGSLASTANTASSNAVNGLNQLGQIIGNVATTVTGAVVGTAAAVGMAIDGVIKGVVDTWNGFWGGVFGGTHSGKSAADVRTAAGVVSSKANTADATAAAAAQRALDQGTKAAALLNSLRAGYTVDTISSSSTWTKPAELSEIFVALFGGGGKGSNGSGTSGGNAGTAGKVIAAQLDPAAIGATVSVTIGTGTSTTPSNTSFGSFISTADAYQAYVSTPLGLMSNFSQASSGGVGSAAKAGVGTAGFSTTFGLAGGAGGGFNPGSSGSAGNAGLNFGLCLTGGSGGGGGSGGNSSPGFPLTANANGGNGGAGGLPGGGGGGGGGADTGGTPGTGGNGGNGLCLVIYKLAKDT